MLGNFKFESLNAFRMRIQREIPKALVGWDKKKGPDFDIEGP